MNENENEPHLFLKRLYFFIPSYTKIARMLGFVSSSTVTRLIQGTTKIPREATRSRIEKFQKTHQNDFLSFERFPRVNLSKNKIVRSLHYHQLKQLVEDGGANLIGEIFVSFVKDYDNWD